MKKLLFILLILCINQAHAQKKKNPSDSTKKIIYSEIVKIDSTNRFELYRKAAKWIESQKFTILEEDQIAGKLLAKNKIVVYTDKSVLAKPNGEFNHDVLIEIKEGKYRYSFTNFVFTYYKQDRNMKYVPVKGKKPMEDTKAPGWKKQWARNKMQVTAEINNHIINLKEAMKYVAPKPVATPKAKEEW